ncbi:MAG: hypothetical protein IPJ71_03810 [Bdellovibrionales bacterium]|nr:hypothetical protein [Bdellovibrionales bacterium]
MRSAEEIFFRLMVHTGSEHSLTEVLKKVGGFKWGIHELTWSHVEFVKTKRMFERAQEEFGLKLSFNVNGPISSAVETAVLAVADEAVTVTAVAPPPPVEEASGPSGGQRSLCRMLIGRDGSAAGELGLAFAP